MGLHCVFNEIPPRRHRGKMTFSQFYIEHNRFKVSQARALRSEKREYSATALKPNLSSCDVISSFGAISTLSIVFAAHS